MRYDKGIGFVRFILRLIVLLSCCLIASAIQARPLSADEVPEPLRPWVGWVLQAQGDRACPFLYNNFEQRRCAWPARLELDLTGNRGSFIHTWWVYQGSWVLLPGEAKHWPQEVTVDGNPALVVEREGKPALWLEADKHQIRGHFSWDRLPEALALPADTGLVALTVKGSPIAFPDIDMEGQLWLKERDTGHKAREALGNRLELQVFRRVIDEIPLQVVTRLHLDITGDQREVLLGTALLEGFVPLSLHSPLPARLEPDGRLRLQVRPGRWNMELAARYPSDATQLPLAASPTPWPDTEVWVFDARNHLRLVEIEGVPTVDPRQTNLPQDWQHLPAYRLQPGDTLALKVIRRGDPEPEPDRLSLNRHLWLNFDGKGYTLNDTVTGSMTHSWRLETNGNLILGRVAVDGKPQFITTLPGSDQPGVEVRRGVINLTADLRYEGDVSLLPAVGWDHDFQQVNATLHLPPGWKLFSVTGIDNVPATWLQRWTLLELFLVLIAALATGRLWGRTWGLLVLVTLGLLWHEPGAPRYVWLHLLAAIALLKVLPEGRFRSLVSGYRNVSLIVLLLIGLPFMVDQVRIGLYPPLERPWQVMPAGEAELGTLMPPAAPPVETRSNLEGTVEREDKAAKYRLKEQEEEVYNLAAPEGAAPLPSRATMLPQLDPKARIQTGPGLPRWRWTEISLSWNGPVERDQLIGLVLLSPTPNLMLNLLRVVLLALLALLMFGFAYTRGQGWHRMTAAAAAILLAWLVLPVFSLTPPTARADFPDPKLLEELKVRLLAPPECLPACAQSPRLRLEISPEALQARMEIHAIENVAVPLPAHVTHWLPSKIMVDGAAVEGLFRTPSGEIWLNLASGRHQVMLAGPLPPRNSLQLPLPLRPHRVEIEARGWQVEGVHENGVPDAQLKFSRISTEAAKDLPALEPEALPPFVQVERTLRLGLDWQVETRIMRLSPPGSAVVLEVPLIEGESVTTLGVRVENGKVLVNMPPEQAAMVWESVLEKHPRITLTAPESTLWAEWWRADISPIWHAVPSGIPVVHHQDPNSRWLPEWRPWPGETVSLVVSRPEGVPGQTLTVDSSRLLTKPGERATDTTLELTLRSSQGGQHTLLLPQGAQLQSVTINGTAQPIRQVDRQVTLPITPGQQTITLLWRESEGIRAVFETPPVDLATSSVNSTLNVTLGEDRWVLWTGGPRLGPAVLFWGVLLVIILVAVALGRIPLTPLKTRQWLLLGLGLSQVPVWAGLTVVGWLLALGGRAKLRPEIGKTLFNTLQLGLGILTVAALVLLFEAIQKGLLGLPVMQIAGNNSSAYNLNWYQDRAQAQLPQAWLVSAPLPVYRLLMLAWALWLALALLRWLQWGWRCFATHGLWRPFHLFKRKPVTPPASNEDKREDKKN